MSAQVVAFDAQRFLPPAPASTAGLSAGAAGWPWLGPVCANEPRAGDAGARLVLELVLDYVGN